MKSFIVRWTVSSMCGESSFRVVAESLEKAKELFEPFIIQDKENSYFWEQACRAVERHYGGYIDWKVEGDTNMEKGCYELPFDSCFSGSDHLND